MLNRLVFITAFLLNLNVSAQTANTRSIQNLCSSLGESSGLIIVDGQWVTHNDSGGEAKLYVLDSVSGCVTREVVIENVINTDWEAVTLDDDYIYIGDFGNNSGNRTDLKILKILIADFISLDTVIPSVINFNYSDQTDFTPASNNTIWDCEAMVSMGDSLVLFSKNWTANVSSIYSLPKVSGAYSITESAQITTDGKITDACLNEANNQLIMVGYSILPFVSVIDNVINIGDITSANYRFDYDLQVDNSLQVEGVFLTNDKAYFTSENFSFGGTNLIADFGEILLPLESLAIEETGSSLRFWKMDSQLHFENNEIQITGIELYDLQGKLVLIKDFSGHKGLISMNGKTFGMFFAKIKYHNKKVETVKIWNY